MSVSRKNSRQVLPPEEEAVDEPEDEDEPDYEVGYKKPPKHSQFKPGNKLGKGRRHGSKALKTIVKEAIALKLPAKIGGKQKSLTKGELAIHQLATKASQGDLKAIEKLIPLMERFGPQDDPDGPDPRKLNLDFETLRDILAMKDKLNPPANEEEDGDE